MSLSHLIQKILIDNNEFNVKQVGHPVKYSLVNISDRINNLFTKLTSQNIPIKDMLIGIAISNSIDFVAVDLLCLTKNAVSMPIPLEFTDNQLFSFLQNADYCIVGNIKIAEKINKIVSDMMIISSQGEIIYNKKQKIIPKWPEYNTSGIIKVIHTSGTTSIPKGVKITDHGLGLLLQKLIELHKHLDGNLHYFSLVSMSLLIEQVLGLYLPLMMNGSLTFLPEWLLPIGSGTTAPSKYIKFFKQVNITFIYMPPILI